MSWLSDGVLAHLRMPDDDAEVLSEPLPREVPADRFDLLEQAGAGGMGEVFRACDRATGEIVAVKLLRECDVSSYARFHREACLLAPLGHPAIVRYLAHGRMGDRPYLAMEWLEGESLEDHIAEHGFTVAESVLLTRRLAEALGFAHARGVVHRDVKPSNVLLVRGAIAEAKLLDFGLARPAWSGDNTVTETGIVVGTPGYMAPEQARGSPFVDARADVFALGCLLYRCLTGRRPFRGDDLLAVLAKTVFTEAPRVADLCPDAPEALYALVSRMLAKDPAARPRDGDEVATELDAILVPDGGEWRAPTSAALARLTDTEQRIGSVIAIARVHAQPTAENGAPSAASGASAPRTTIPYGDPERWVECAMRFGARLEWLADGSVVATLRGRGGGAGEAAQAARCALALRGHLPHPPIVLATGRALVREEGLPIGDVIDRAARMLADAQRRRPPTERAVGPAPVVVDEVTAGLLDERFDVVLGKQGLLLRGELRPEERVRTLLGKPTPCVGRERELALLEATFDECVGEPAARTVLVTAASGVGKSRLRYEIVRTLRELPVPPEVWIGRGDPVAAGSPFGLLAQALRREMGVMDGEPVEERRMSVKSRVARHLPAGDRDRVSCFLGELVGTPFEADNDARLRAARREPSLMGEHMLRAFHDFLRAETSAHPVVLVLEDLQWGDLPSIRFVDMARRELADKPLLVLAFGRPEVHDVFPNLWKENDAQVVRLGGLGRQGSERLVREVLGPNLDPTLVDRIVGNADGNAFFLEELIRAAAEGKGDAVPETVLAIVEARLQGLDPDQRRVLRAASVFGQTAWTGATQALVADAEIATVLEALREAELVTLRLESRFPDEREFVFRHALVREAAYGMLTDDDRELGHRLAAAWLERAGETDAMTLAEHYDRGGDSHRAVGWFERAAREALRGNDFAQARRRAERGLECARSTVNGALSVKPDDTVGALLLVQAEALRWTGEARGALGCASAAARELSRGSDGWFRAVAEVCASAGRLGDYDELDRALSDAVAVEAAPELRSAQVAALCPGAAQLVQAGRGEAADHLLSAIEALAATAPDLDPTAVARLEQLRGFHAIRRGDAASARASYRAALTAFERVGRARNALVEQVNVAHAAAELGLFEEAETTLQSALHRAEVLGLATVRAFACLNLGRVLIQLGRLDEAERAELTALALGRSEGSPRIEGAARVHLSEIAYRRNEIERSEREARAAVGLLAVAPPLQAGALASLARALVASGRAHEAHPPSRLAFSIIESGATEIFDALVRLTFCEVLEALGDVEGALEHARHAAERLRAQAARFGDPALAKSYLERVELNARTLAFADRARVS